MKFTLVHYTHVDTKHLQGLLLMAIFSDAVKPQRCISWPVWPLRGINKTALGAKLILTADLVYSLGCASLGHLLMTQHYRLCLNVCFSTPMAPHESQPPTPSLFLPVHPPVESIRDIITIKKTTSKTRDMQIACRISYEILAIQLGCLCCS